MRRWLARCCGRWHRHFGLSLESVQSLDSRVGVGFVRVLRSASHSPKTRVLGYLEILHCKLSVIGLCWSF